MAGRISKVTEAIANGRTPRLFLSPLTVVAVIQMTKLRGVSLTSISNYCISEKGYVNKVDIKSLALRFYL